MRTYVAYKGAPMLYVNAHLCCI